MYREGQSPDQEKVTYSFLRGVFRVYRQAGAQREIESFAAVTR